MPAAPAQAGSDLRQRAEQEVRANKAKDPDTLAPEEAAHSLHELRVHQIELELQNEELRRAQEAIDASRTRYFDLYDLAPVGYLTLSEPGLILEANLTAATLLGVVRSALVKQPLTRFIVSEDQDIYYKHRRQLFETGDQQACEMRMLRGDAAPFWARLEAAAAQDADGSPMCRIVMSDITDWKRAEEALREAETRYRLLFEHSPDGIVIVDPATARPLEFNETAHRQLGYTRDEFARLNISDLDILETPEQTQSRIAQVLREGRNDFDTRQRTRQGETRDVHVTAQVTEILGRPVYHCIWRDITERKQAEKALRESEEQYRNLFESMEQGVVYQMADGGIVSANPAAERILGLSLEQMKGRVSTDPRWRCVREDGSDFPGDQHPAMLALRSGRSVLGTLMGVFHPGEDQHRWILVDAVPEFRAGQASPHRVYTILSDITTRRRAEAERENLGIQLRQAQKMEAVGQLAGGVAHDFNNALTVILGFAESALRQLNPLDPLRHHMHQIVAAVDKSANLTRQLLAFARRQIVTPRVLDVDDAIASLAKMLPRLIGEDIDLRIVPGEGLWNVNIDPSQVDQILINLVTNARDAIANTGTITIETANVVLGKERCRRHPAVTPGDYVVLTVSDTGAGMDKVTIERIFDPFFTTKAEGKGTGLGLATVYGIAKQSGGFVDVYSEPGHGTTFQVYLPRFFGEAEQPVQRKAPSSVRGTETVLIVEDEPLLLEIVQEGLQELGYDVLAAGSPGDAILLCEKHAGEIRLLVTDVIMPAMNGKELQQRLERITPGLRTIFMSGYTADVVTHRGVVEADMLFVQKPFTIRALAEKIREALD
jgi:two-component system, cell cycle sensor histidine kinase and response regulator CckA